MTSRKKKMIVAVLNFSGNTGKTTLTTNLIAPRLGASIVRIESINSGDESADAEITAKQFKDLAARLLTLGDERLVIDIGASNIESVLAQMKTMSGMEEDIDLWILPVTPELKQQRDTASTIQALLAVGASPAAILVVPNRVTDPDAMDMDFGGIKNACRKDGVRLIEPGVLESDAYPLIPAGRTIPELAADEADYKGEIATTKDPAEKARLADLVIARRLARSANANLDAIWAAMDIA